MVEDSIQATPGRRARVSGCLACRSAPRWSGRRCKSSRAPVRARRFSCAWRSWQINHGRPTMPEPVRILLADDHVTVRHGLKLLIDSQPDMKVVAEASDGKAAIDSAVALKPDVIVMD